MTTLHRILVSLLNTDNKFSAATCKAMQLARAAGATVELFHALRPPLHGVAAAYADSTAQLIAQARSLALRQLTAIAVHWRQTGIDVQVAVAVDYPAYEAIIRRAVQSKATLIMLDGHVRHRFARILQLTDWELLRCSPVPVLIVRRADGYIEPTVLAAIDPMHVHAKSGNLDRAILDYAAQIAQHLNGALHVVHAMPRLLAAKPGIAPEERANIAQHIMPCALDPKPVALPGPQTELDAAQMRADDAASKQLEHWLARTGIKPQHVHLLTSPAREAIADVARRANAQIIVLGVISRSALGRLLIGNTAEAVLDVVDCDVLLVKPHGFRTPVAQRMRRGVQPVPVT